MKEILILYNKWCKKINKNNFTEFIFELTGVDETGMKLVNNYTALKDDEEGSIKIYNKENKLITILDRSYLTSDQFKNKLKILEDKL